MKHFDPRIHHRRTTRLKHHDYSGKALYFITIICRNRVRYFGRVENEMMILNEIGEIADKYWLEIPDHFPNSILHIHQVMPEHFHAILELKKAENKPETKSLNQFGKPIKGSLSVIIDQYKASVKRWCNKNGHKNFQWQSKFRDEVIHDIQSYIIITKYIKENPANYMKGKYKPD